MAVGKCCKDCGQKKESSDFYTDRYTKDGLSVYCRECVCARKKDLWRRKNAGVSIATYSQSIAANDTHKRCPLCKEVKPLNDFYRVARSKTGYGALCRKCHCQRTEVCIASDPVRLARTQKKRHEYYASRRDAGTLTTKRDKANDSRRAKRKYHEKMKTPGGHMEIKMLAQIRNSVTRPQGQKRRTEWATVLGYTFPELQRHIVSLFTPGMTWEKVKNGTIQIDHVLPRASFHYETVEDTDFRACWALTNLQPLWKRDNRSKGDKMPDGSSGRAIGRLKRRLLNEEFSVAGYERQRSASFPEHEVGS